MRILWKENFQVSKDIIFPALSLTLITFFTFQFLVILVFYRIIFNFLYWHLLFCSRNFPNSSLLVSFIYNSSLTYPKKNFSRIEGYCISIHIFNGDSFLCFSVHRIFSILQNKFWFCLLMCSIVVPKFCQLSFLYFFCL